MKRINHDHLNHFRIIICMLLFLSSGKIFGQNTDLKLWYRQPAKQWEETLPLGNGKIGMMPDGGLQTEQLVLNDITLWSGSPQDANNDEAGNYLDSIRSLIKKGKNDLAQQLIDQHFVCKGPGSGGKQWGCYQNLGNLTLNFDHKMDIAKVKNYHRELDLEHAIVRTSYQLDGINYSREYWTSFSDDVAVIKLKSSKRGKINLQIKIERSERATSFTKDGELILFGQLDNGVDGKGMQFKTRIRTKIKGGIQQINSQNIEIKGADEVLLYLATDTDFKGKDFETTSRATLDAAMKKSYEKQYAEHIKHYTEKFDRLRLTLGRSKTDLPTDQRLVSFGKEPDADPGLAVLFYQYGRYLSISSTRIGLLPPNLQGLWANQIQTPWNSDYHLDINVQMNHWHLGAANLGELNEPLVNLVEGLMIPGQRTAKAYYHANGWVAHVITNVWGYTAPGESASWGITNAGSGWLCNNLWEHYLYSEDKTYLNRIYPILYGAAQFYANALTTYPSKGWLVTSPSVSPENSFKLPNGHQVNVTMGPTIDNQIVRELFQNLIEASQILEKSSDPFITEVTQKLKKLAPVVQIGKDGRIMEWIEDYEEVDPQHRHISHLYGLYPGYLIQKDNNPVWADAARKSLEVRVDDGPSWAIAHKMLFWSRLHDGERAYKLFKQLMTPRVDTRINYGAGGGVYSNLLAAGPPFQIDGNFGGAAGIAEMLVQSHADSVYLLPAIPRAWKKEGNIRGIRLKGNCTLEMTWKEGEIVNYKINSPRHKKINVYKNGKWELYHTS
ncbi:glycoside hydrolase N-terminal domain-containing protein [Sphingobacterium sp. SRCM116780]|uniref:glycosyl hydrolase family 95 catalytic domain-containing protein n=1 Tax=Sphingobacterium sp. SRCM116780 TaxID=2907623 RepID=UPI001F2AA2F8|nr:glycoside hydrolase N-terminal domain-containing protein [Sphingobacterium sp. SRCM116780]UIR54815.1 glycoside hydrolase N-terminal domain-containing protein [Sphingobacterium sp. SRCM116780]